MKVSRYLFLVLASAVFGCNRPSPNPHTVLPATQTSALVVAAGNGNLPEVKSLLSGGSNPNVQECNDLTEIVGKSCQSLGWTPLMIAAGHGREDIVSELLRAGADRFLRDSDDHDALWYAKQSSNQHVVALLASTPGG